MAKCIYFLFWIFMHVMCVCIGMSFACVYLCDICSQVCACACACIGVERRISDILLYHSSICSLQTWLLTGPGARLVAIEPLWFSCIHPHSARVTVQSHPTHSLWGLGSELSSLCWSSKYAILLGGVFLTQGNSEQTQGKLSASPPFTLKTKNTFSEGTSSSCCQEGQMLITEDCFQHIQTGEGITDTCISHFSN